MYALLSSKRAKCPTHLSLLSLIFTNNIWRGTENNIVIKFVHFYVTSSSLGPNISLSTDRYRNELHYLK
jgi:hypothetical protein